MMQESETIRRERARLVRLGYSMLGVEQDAEEIAQEVFARAIARGPGVEDAIGAWMTRVAMNLAIDALRARKRAPYIGPWLPEPIATQEPSPEDAALVREAIDYAFLVAVEELSAIQRAVLLLRDVFELSTSESAKALGISEANVKTTLHRARKKLDTRERSPWPSAPEVQARREGILGELFTAIATGDIETATAWLREDVVMKNDGGGRYAAAIRPVYGREKVMRFLLHRAMETLSASDASIQRLALNGAPAILLEYTPKKAKHPPRTALLFTFDGEDRVREILAVVHPDKVAALFSTE